MQSGRYVRATEEELVEELAGLNEIEEGLPQLSLSKDKPTSVEEDPALHGIFFQDQKAYDYMQHLKPMGEDPSAVFVSAPGSKSTPTTTILGGISLPSEALPSGTETPVGLLNLASMNPTVSDPALDPGIREVLYALDDEAYVEDDLEEDFFEALGADEVPSQYAELVAQGEEGAAALGTWEQEQRQYTRKTAIYASDESDDEETRDALGPLSGPPKSTKAKSKYARTNASMSSSAMFRNQQLELLDDRFDLLMKKYDLGNDEDSYEEGDSDFGTAAQYDSADEEDDEEAMGTLDLADVDALMDAFLEETEVIGRRGRVIPKRDSLLAEEGREPVDVVLQRLALSSNANSTESFEELEDASDADNLEDAWDVETVLSTLSNAYNRPILIQEAGKGVAKIRLKGRNKMPTVMESDNEENDENDEETRIGRIFFSFYRGMIANAIDTADNKGAARPKKETAEEKKARKAALKDERRSRRVEKKATQKAFKDEENRQLKSLSQKKRSAGMQSIL